MRDLVLNRMCFWFFGTRPRRVLDFIGLNYYSRQVIRWRPARGSALLFGSECMEDHHGEPRAFSSLGWEIYAPGLAQVLRSYARYGVPLMVTENGLATDDEVLRTRFLTDHVAAVADAVRAGVPVVGYLYWTLMDNYEWTEGRSARFGLAETDFASQGRAPRPAALAFKAICEANMTPVTGLWKY
jgi:beta-glucosidase